MNTTQVMNTVIINGTEMAVREWQGQRVVTFADIDRVHQRPEGTARKRFNDNKKHFILGVDYFVRKTDEAKKEFGIIAPNGLILLTEQGYLMVVKSLKDDLAWQVHNEVIESYFHQNTPKISEPEANFASINSQIALYNESRDINIKLLNDQFLVSSREVAENFEKEHDKVCRDIARLLESQPPELAIEFIKSEYISDRGRTYTEYLMNRDGFSLLAMGFTGKKALEWKLKYIKAFNAMEAAWNSPERMLARALQLSNTENKQLKQEKELLIEQIHEDAPKIEEWERFMDSDGTISMNDTAKLLQTGRNQLMKFLRHKRILLKDRSAATQYVKRGYFHVSIESGVGLYGKEYHTPITRTTAKGMSFLYRYLKKHYDEYLEYDENFVVDGSMAVL